MYALVERNAARIAIGLWLLSFVYHLATLTLSPVVWTDEVFFNSITLDWLQHGTFRCPVDFHYTEGKPVLAYGPVFFWLNAFVIKLFGNGLFQGRLLCLLSGMGLLVWFTAIAKRYIPQPVLWLATLLLLLLDPFFSAALHWARMDLLATLLFAASGTIFFKRLESTTSSKGVDARAWLLSGSLFAVAMLATPRVALLGLTPAVLVLWTGLRENFSRRYFLHVLLWLLPVVVLYGIWVFYAFGDVGSFVSYYTGVQAKLMLQERGFYLPRELYPLIIATSAVVLTGMVMLKQRYFTPVNIFCISTLISYYIFVQDTGPYSAIVTPFYYLLIGNSIQQLWEQKNFKRLGGTIIVLLMGFNSLIFVLKATTLVAEAPNRKQASVESFVLTNIPRDARVAGDVVYYYAAVNNGYPFHLLASYQFYFAPTAEYTLKEFDYDYIIISERLKAASPKLYNMYMTQASLEPIDTLTTERSALLQTLSKAGLYGYGGYDGVIYKRMR